MSPLHTAAALIIALVATLIIFEITESDRGGVKKMWRDVLDWLDEKGGH